MASIMSMLSEAVEDYLKAIYTLRQDGEPVGTSAIAQRLEVAPASVTQMLKKLDQMRPRLVEYRRHHGVTLTRHGEKIALEVIRHHRLVELFLQQALGMSWDEVDQEAERLEHVVSEALADRIAAVLGDPKFDPHGAPIPPKNGKMPVNTLHRLADSAVGDELRVREVCDDDPEILRYLGGLGIVPNAVITVLECGPFDGPIHIRIGADPDRHALGRRVAALVSVEPSTQG